MKILIATDSYIHNLAGVTGSILALSSGLRSLGHDVRILSLSSGNQSYRDGNDYFIRSFPAFVYPDLRVSFAQNDSLLKEIETWKPDLVHAQTEGSARRFAIRIMKRCHVPLVMTCHTDYGYYVFGKTRSFPPFRKLMEIVGYCLYRHAEKNNGTLRESSGVSASAHAAAARHGHSERNGTGKVPEPFFRPGAARVSFVIGDR